MNQLDKCESIEKEGENTKSKLSEVFLLFKSLISELDIKCNFIFRDRSANSFRYSEVVKPLLKYGVR